MATTLSETRSVLKVLRTDTYTPLIPIEQYFSNVVGYTLDYGEPFWVASNTVLDNCGGQFFIGARNKPWFVGPYRGGNGITVHNDITQPDTLGLIELDTSVVHGGVNLANVTTLNGFHWNGKHIGSSDVVAAHSVKGDYFIPTISYQVNTASNAILDYSFDAFIYEPALKFRRHENTNLFSLIVGVGTLTPYPSGNYASLDNFTGSGTTYFSNNGGVAITSSMLTKTSSAYTIPSQIGTDYAYYPVVYYKSGELMDTEGGLRKLAVQMPRTGSTLTIRTPESGGSGGGPYFVVKNVKVEVDDSNNSRFNLSEVAVPDTVDKMDNGQSMKTMLYRSSDATITIDTLAADNNTIVFTNTNTDKDLNLILISDTDAEFRVNARSSYGVLTSATSMNVNIPASSTIEVSLMRVTTDKSSNALLTVVSEPYFTYDYLYNGK